MRLSLIVAVALLPVQLLADDKPARPLGYGPLPAGAWACLGSPRLVGDKPPSTNAFSPDGKWLASGTGEYRAGAGTDIHLWDLSTGREVHTLRGHKHVVVGIRFTADSKKLVSAAWDNTIRVWDVASGKEERQFVGHERSITGLELTADDRYLVSSSQDGTIRVWNFADGKELRRIKDGGEISLAPDGRRLAVAGGGASLWDIHTRKQIQELVKSEPPYVDGVRWSPDGKTLAVLRAGDVSLWDVAAGSERVRLQGLKRKAFVVAFTPDGKVLATGGGGYEQPGPVFKGFLSELKLWEAASGKELRTCEGHTGVVKGLAFSPDGQTLASAGDYDFSVRLWDSKTGREARQFIGHSHEITSLVYSPDGGTLYSSSYDGTVRVWDALAGSEKAVFRGHTHWVMGISLTPDGKTLASGGRDGTVRLWDLAARRELRRLADQGEVWCVAFAPEGKMLAWGSRGSGGSGGALRLWDWQAGKDPDGLTEQGGGHCLAFPRDGKTLAVGFHHAIFVWDLTAGKPVQRLRSAHGEFVRAMGYLPDGTLASAGGADRVMEHALRLWNPTTGQRVHQFPIAIGYQTTMAVSPDGRLLAVAVENKVQVWEVSTRHKAAEFQGHRRHISALAFSPEGRTLASGGADGAILFWDLTGLRTENGLARKPLKPDELDRLWKELEQDAGRQAMWRLVAAPEQAIPWLRQQVPAIPRIDPLRLRQLVRELDADNFGVREQAMRELQRLGTAAVPELERILKGKPVPEVARRAEQLLDELARKQRQESGRLPSAQVQILRALESLERTGTAEAWGVIQKIAEGEPTARQTQEALAILKRRLP